MRVKKSNLVGVAKDGKIDPVLCVELHRRVGKREMEKIRGELLELGAKNPRTGHIKTVLFHAAFPVDIRHNAKIFREKLSVWSQEVLRKGGQG